MVSRRTSRRSLIGGGVGAGLAVVFGARGASASLPVFTPEERERLAKGGAPVWRPVDVETPEGSYFGGVSYAHVEASPEVVMATLEDLRAYRQIFPLCMEARLVQRKGQDSWVYFRTGGKAGTADYTLVARRESPGFLRFWLDRSRPHDIADCWGYFRIVPWGTGSLLTYAALLRLDFGVMRMLFTEKIREFAMRTPNLVRRYVHRHHPTGT